MIERILIGLGLIAIPFVELLTALFRAPLDNTRDWKFAISILFALALTLWGFFKGNLVRIRNKWLLIFIFYLFVHTLFLPQFKIALFDTETVNFWLWKPMYNILVFFLMYCAIKGFNFDLRAKEQILKVVSWCGLIMGIYVLLQGLGLDQFFNLKNLPSNEMPTNPRLCGTMGNPTVVAPFIGMCIPAALYLKKYIPFLIMVLAVFLTKSDMAIGALIVALCFYLALRSKKTLVAFVIIGILSSGIVFLNRKVIKINLSGREAVWKNTMNDIKNLNVGRGNLRSIGISKSPLTGYGIGSFAYLYNFAHPPQGRKGMNWFQAHNEYLELIYGTGIAGIALFFMALFYQIKNSFILGNTINRPLLTSLIFICLCAVGTFVWQVGAHIYYTITMLGLLTYKEAV